MYKRQVQDTIRDCVKSTLEKNFELIEKYPHYKMNFEGAFRYKLAKEYYPDLYEKLKGYIAEGRWTVSGSTWDAMDVNVPSSEALMRQVDVYKRQVRIQPYRLHQYLHNPPGYLQRLREGLHIPVHPQEL